MKDWTAVYQEIVEERQGTPELDDARNVGEWLARIRSCLSPLSPQDFRRNMVTVAALACAAIDSYDRTKERLAETGGAHA